VNSSACQLLKIEIISNVRLPHTKQEIENKFQQLRIRKDKQFDKNIFLLTKQNANNN